MSEGQLIQSGALSLLTSIVEKERLVKQFRDSFDGASSLKIQEISIQIRNEYHTLLIDYEGYNFEKDIIGLLWKNCFYRNIEEFRKSLKALKCQLDVNRFNEKLTNHMVRLSQEFSSFLSDASSYFSGVMVKLENKAAELSGDEARRHRLYNGVYRCLLYLGDLSRYKALYSEKVQKDFSASVRFYEKAALLMPSSGNPHNQLAMLATYNEAESTALYHYCRSVLTENPFSGGFDNLARLFVLNKSSYDSLHDQILHLRTQKNESLKFKYFLTAFVRLHGLFFAWTVRMHLDFVRSTEDCSQVSADSSVLLAQINDLLTKALLGSKVVVDVEEMEMLMQIVLKEYDTIIYSSKLTDLHLLRLLAIGMFSVHFAAFPTVEAFRDSDFSSFLRDSSQCNDSKERTIMQSLAMGLLNSFVARAVNKLSKQLKECQDRSGKKVTLEKAMSMLVVFAEWNRLHPAFVEAPTSILFEQGEEMKNNPTFDSIGLIPPAVFTVASLPNWRLRFVADLSLLRTEARTRSNLRSAFSLLQESWNKQRPLTLSENNSILREHAEMRGYLPLKEGLETYFQNFDPLAGNVSWSGDQKAKAYRRQILQEFVGKFILKTDVSSGENILSERKTKTPGQVPEERGEIGDSTFQVSPNFQLDQKQIQVKTADQSFLEESEEIDEVVFRPMFRKQYEEANLSLEVQESQKNDEVDIYTSLGLKKPNSFPELTELPNVWESFGVVNAENILDFRLSKDLSNWNNLLSNQKSEAIFHDQIPFPDKASQGIAAPPGLSNLPIHRNLNTMKDISEKSNFLRYLKLSQDQSQSGWDS